MTRPVTLVWVVGMATMCIGCQAPIRIQPGMSAIAIRVVAQPKQGYRPPGRRPPDSVDPYEFESSSPAETAAFSRVDYRQLENIVVWLEPLWEEIPPTELPVVTIDFDTSRPPPDAIPFYVTGIGGRLEFHNGASRNEVIYSLSEPNVFDLGSVSSQAVASYEVRGPGLIDVFCDSVEAPLVHVFVAPSPLVRQITSRDKATFTDLRPGQYRVTCWHPRLPGSSATCTLQPDRLAAAVLTISVDTLPEIP